MGRIVSVQALAGIPGGALGCRCGLSALRLQVNLSLMAVLTLVSIVDQFM